MDARCARLRLVGDCGHHNEKLTASTKLSVSRQVGKKTPCQGHCSYGRITGREKTRSSCCPGSGLSRFPKGCFSVVQGRREVATLVEQGEKRGTYVKFWDVVLKSLH